MFQKAFEWGKFLISYFKILSKFTDIEYTHWFKTKSHFPFASWSIFYSVWVEMLPSVIATCRKWFCFLELKWSRDYLKRFYGKLRSLRHRVCPEGISSVDAFERSYLCFTLSWYVFSFLNQWTQLLHVAPQAVVAINSWFSA